MSINNVVAFQGWNSSNRAWNTGTWNGDVAYTVTATGQIGAGTGEVFPTWGQIIPSQTPNFSTISPSQTPSWENIAA